MIAVDIGCKPYGHDDSIGVLRRTYKATTIYGFDPHPELTEGQERLGSCVVITRRLAAWTREGYVPWSQSGSGSAVDFTSTVTVPCFDLAAFLHSLPPVGVLKIDAEGAEYKLIPHLLAQGADRCVETLLIEWHGDPIDTVGQWDVQLWHQPA